jgi:DNA polymerase III subunit epsilon
MLLDEVPFVVTDTETTGTQAASGRIIEIGAVRVQGGEIVDTFAELINPGRAIPRFITDLTGITTAMVYGRPTAEEVLPGYLAFLSDGVFAAHNLSFDLGFINAELRRGGLDELKSGTVCTLRLARRLLPGLRSKGLSSLADFFGLKFNGRHRALGDAEVTARILIAFLERLRRDHGVSTLAELFLFQHSSYARVGHTEPRHVARIRNEILPGLPERPGVYFMKDTRGEIIYIGKAADLRSRVRSYFTAIEAHPPRLRKLVETVRTVEWEETASELGALVLESQLIKKKQPSFNRAQKQYRTRPFIRLDLTEPYPRLGWTPYLLNDGAEYFGPVASKKEAEEIVSLISMAFQVRKCDDVTFKQGKACLYASLGKCCAPCERLDVDEKYRAEIERVRAFLKGEDDAALDRMNSEMKAAAGRMDFETAARYRDGIQRLESLRTRQQLVSAPVLEHDGLVLQARRGGGYDVLFVRYGRMIASMTFDSEAFSDGGEVARAVSGLLVNNAAPPDRYFREQADEIRLLTHWMYTNRDSVIQVIRIESETNERFLQRVREAAGMSAAAST